MLTTLVSWRRPVALAIVAVLSAVLGVAVDRPATAAPTAPAAINLDAIRSDTQAPAGTPTTSVPSVLAVANQNLAVTVSFFDSLGRPAFFTKNTRLVVTSDRGAVTNIDTVALKGEYTSTLIVAMPSTANQVRLSVAVSAGKASFSDAADDHQRFDVLSQLRFEPSSVNFRQGIGGEGDCDQATPADPVCGIVILPQGASSSEVLLSLGPCDDTAYSGCGDPRGSVVQTLADLDGYSATSPATVLIKCDKTLCGGGAIRSQFLSYTLDGNVPLAPAEACPAKGTVGTEPACVDYVQSKRDGSGDTHLYLLFIRDARISVG